VSGSSKEYYVRADKKTHEDFQEMFLGVAPTEGTFMGETIMHIDWSTKTESYIITTGVEDREEEEVSYNVNGDIVIATKTGDVFLYLGGKYYNLSSDDKEMRGRSHIKHSDGPLQTISNLKNSGDMFKESMVEAVQKAGVTEMTAAEVYSRTSAASAPF